MQALKESECIAASRECVFYKTKAICQRCALLRTLSHRHIVQYVESFVEDMVLHIVMELCEQGPSLS